MSWWCPIPTLRILAPSTLSPLMPWSLPLTAFICPVGSMGLALCLPTPAASKTPPASPGRPLTRPRRRPSALTWQPIGSLNPSPRPSAWRFRLASASLGCPRPPPAFWEQTPEQPQPRPAFADESATPPSSFLHRPTSFRPNLSCPLRSHCNVGKWMVWSPVFCQWPERSLRYSVWWSASDWSPLEWNRWSGDQAARLAPVCTFRS